MIERFNIIGLPSGEVIQVSKSQLDRLKRENLVLMVKRYMDVMLDNEYCFDDKNMGKVRIVALSQIIDDLEED